MSRPPRTLRELEARKRAEQVKRQEPRYNMRHPEFLYALQKLRLCVVASWDDPMWDADTKADARASTAMKIQSRQKVIIEPFTVTFRPPEDEDFDTHPDAYLSLDMLGFHAQSRQGPVEPRMYRWNQLFFVIERTYVQKMLRGQRTVDDLLDFLFKTNVS